VGTIFCIESSFRLTILVDINIIERVSTPRIVSRETTLHVRDRCLCFRAQRAARALARRFDEVFRPLGLTNGQFSLMMSLNRPEPPTMGRIAKGLAMDRTTLTAALKPLERRALVRVLPNPLDRRQRVVQLTPRGRALLARAVPIWTQAHADLERELPDPDRARAMLESLA
jgi:DNA-binding MarR family transcriptional regulator